MDIDSPVMTGTSCLNPFRLTASHLQRIMYASRFLTSISLKLCRCAHSSSTWSLYWCFALYPTCRSVPDYHGSLLPKIGNSAHVDSNHYFSETLQNRSPLFQIKLWTWICARVLFSAFFHKWRSQESGPALQVLYVKSSYTNTFSYQLNFSCHFAFQLQIRLG